MAYVGEKAGLHYAVIYEGVNPVTGKERRRWHRCSHRGEAQRLPADSGRSEREVDGLVPA